MSLGEWAHSGRHHWWLFCLVGKTEVRPGAFFIQAGSNFFLRFVVVAGLPWKVLTRATWEAGVTAPPGGMQLHLISYD